MKITNYLTKNKIIEGLSLYILVAALSGCVLYHVEKTPTTREAHYLMPAERSRLENLAIEKSDDKAAYDLALYYELSAYDELRAYKWFKIAKSLGNKKANDWIKTIERNVPKRELIF